MQSTRRSFFKCLVAYVIAPSVVRAECLKPTSIVEGFGDSDFTIETWIRPDCHNVWKHIAQIQRCGHLECYSNGMLVLASEFEAHGFKLIVENGRYTLGWDRADISRHVDSSFPGQLKDVRFISIACDPSTLSYHRKHDRSFVRA